jgi:hypothetical protein
MATWFADRKKLWAAPRFLGVICLSVAVFAQAQIATVTSDGPFQLRSVDVVPGQGVPSWPVMADDTIRAEQNPVTLTFSDGCTVALSPGGVARVELSGKTPVFLLEKGSAHYSLSSLDCVKLVSLKTPLTPTDANGEIVLGPDKLPPGWWTPVHTAAIVAGAAGVVVLGTVIAKLPSASGSQCSNTPGSGLPACP